MSAEYNAAVRTLAAEMPAAWRDDFKPQVAGNIVSSNAAHEVDQGVRQFAGDALPPATRAPTSSLPGGRTGARNIDDSNSNFLRGGIGNMDGNNFRRIRGYDQNGEEDIYDNPDMPVRGRATPAAT